MINVSHLVISSTSITHIRKNIHNLRFNILVKPGPTRSLVQEKLDCAQVIVIVLVKSRRWLMLTKLFFLVCRGKCHMIPGCWRFCYEWHHHPQESFWIPVGRHETSVAIRQTRKISHDINIFHCVTTPVLSHYCILVIMNNRLIEVLLRNVLLSKNAYCFK